MSVPLDLAERIVAQRHEFAFFEEGNFEMFRKRALGGSLRSSNVRSVAWKVFLGVLSQDLSNWGGELAKWRGIYTTHLSEHWVDPHASQNNAQSDNSSNNNDEGNDGGWKVVEEDATTNNPLSQTHESTWHKYFKNQELQAEIRKDLDRLFPEFDFFQRPEPQKHMMRVLFVWARTHPGTSYRQGMHELLAPLLWVVTKESVAVANEFERRDAFLTVVDSQYIEHDSFALFSKLMETMESLFEHNSPASTSTTATTAISVVGGASGGILGSAGSAGLGVAQPDKQPEQNVTPLFRKCQRIFSSLLKSRDPEVYKHLTLMEIEPQLFLLRWLRCLFVREFHLEDVLVLWDGIFADPTPPSLGLADFVCVAMIKYVRTELLGRDQSMCLRRMLRYPPVEDVHSFVAQALVLRGPSSATANLGGGGGQGFSSSSFAPTTKGAQVDPSLSEVYGFAKKSLATALKTSVLTPRLAGRTADSVSTATVFTGATNDQQQQKDAVGVYSGVARDVNRRLGLRMGTLIDVLEEGAAEPEKFNQDHILVAIAQLKQIRDILSGVLPVENMDIIEALEAQEIAAASGMSVAQPQLYADDDQPSSDASNKATDGEIANTHAGDADDDVDSNGSADVGVAKAESASSRSVVVPDEQYLESIPSASSATTSTIAAPATKDTEQFSSFLQDMSSSSASLQPPTIKPPDRKTTPSALVTTTTAPAAAKKVTLQDAGLLELFDSSDSFLQSTKDTSNGTSGSLFGKPGKLPKSSPSLFDELPSHHVDDDDDDIFSSAARAKKNKDSDIGAGSLGGNNNKKNNTASSSVASLFAVDRSNPDSLFG